ncbi:MAG TPA: aldose 1-epimerase family protein [Sphingomonas sp.]|jgi:galactose mutarotase-like enzyme|nr:aldose 1-epimerase family protein [Sphingomonas sp.]
MIALASPALTALVNPLGAELWSLKDADGRELMTDADPGFWAGHAPILFPVVGKPSGEIVRVDGRAYPMKQHGFARHLPFATLARSPDSVTLRLTDDAQTRTHYPFAFRLDIAFRLDGATLAIEVTVANPDDVPLPASFGFHPAFAWPLPYGHPRGDHRIVFDADEPRALREIADDGTIAAALRPSPLDGRTLALADDLFANDALVWDAIVSQGVTYGAVTGPQLKIAFPDTPMLGIWTKPEAHFICIEPWHGIADPHGYTGEFRDKPGIFTLAPGAEKHIAMHVTLTP